MRPTSLNQPLGDDDSTAFGDIIGDEEAMDHYEMLRNKDLRKEVSDLLDVLDEREQKMINSRFGLNGHKTKTLEEVGEKFGRSRASASANCRISRCGNPAATWARRSVPRRNWWFEFGLGRVETGCAASVANRFIFWGGRIRDGWGALNGVLLRNCCMI